MNTKFGCLEKGSRQKLLSFWSWDDSKIESKKFYAKIFLFFLHIVPNILNCAQYYISITLLLCFYYTQQICPQFITRFWMVLETECKKIILLWCTILWSGQVKSQDFSDFFVKLILTNRNNFQNGTVFGKKTVVKTVV